VVVFIAEDGIGKRLLLGGGAASQKETS